MMHPHGISQSFALVESLTEQKKLVQEIVSLQSFVSMQLDPSSEPLTFKVLLWPDLKGGLLIQFQGSALPASVRKKLTECAGSDSVFYFNAFLKTAQLVFKSAFSAFEGESLRFRIPDKIYRLQRRAHLRLELKESGSYVQWGFGKDQETEQRDVLDVSVGGFGFQGRSGDELLIRVGQVLDLASLVVNGRTIEADCEVRHVLKGGAGVKVGVRFKQLKAGDEKFLRDFVTKAMASFLKAIGI